MCENLLCERQHLLKGWIKLFFSHSDSKCWALLNSFLFDLIISSSSCSTLFPPHFFPPIPLSVCFSGGSCNPPAGKELPLSHSVSSFDLLWMNPLQPQHSSVSLFLFSFLSGLCVSHTVLSHAPLSSHPPLLTCPLTGGSETVQIELRELATKKSSVWPEPHTLCCHTVSLTRCHISARFLHPCFNWGQTMADDSGSAFSWDEKFLFTSFFHLNVKWHIHSRSIIPEEKRAARILTTCSNMYESLSPDNQNSRCHFLSVKTGSPKEPRTRFFSCFFFFGHALI